MPVVNDRNILGYYDDSSKEYKQIIGVDGSLKVYIDNDTIIPQTTILTYVQPSDIGVDYVNGSQGEIKTGLKYQTNLPSGSYALLTTYKYKDTNYPKQPTEIIESNSVVP